MSKISMHSVAFRAVYGLSCALILLSLVAIPRFVKNPAKQLIDPALLETILLPKVSETIQIPIPEGLENEEFDLQILGESSAKDYVGEAQDWNEVKLSYPRMLTKSIPDSAEREPAKLFLASRKVAVSSFTSKLKPFAFYALRSDGSLVKLPPQSQAWKANLPNPVVKLKSLENSTIICNLGVETYQKAAKGSSLVTISSGRTPSLPFSVVDLKEDPKANLNTINLKLTVQVKEALQVKLFLRNNSFTTLQNRVLRNNNGTKTKRASLVKARSLSDSLIVATLRLALEDSSASSQKTTISSESLSSGQNSLSSDFSVTSISSSSSNSSSQNFSAGTSSNFSSGNSVNSSAPNSSANSNSDSGASTSNPTNSSSTTSDSSSSISSGPASYLCTDSDNGINTALKGTLSLQGPAPLPAGGTDYCFKEGAFWVSEYRCLKEKYTKIELLNVEAINIRVDCPNGTWCKNGACVPAPPTPTPRPTSTATPTPSPTSTPTPTPTPLDNLCTETDNGIDPFVKGAISYVSAIPGSVLTTKIDKCNSYNSVYEYSCSLSKPEAYSETVVLCPQDRPRCINGACSSAKCQDTDGGDDINVAGVVVVENRAPSGAETKVTYADKCLDANTITEFICGDDAAAVEKIHSCPYPSRCELGKCQGGGTPTPTPSPTPTPLGQKVYCLCHWQTNGHYSCDDERFEQQCEDFLNSPVCVNATKKEKIGVLTQETLSMDSNAYHWCIIPPEKPTAISGYDKVEYQYNGHGSDLTGPQCMDIVMEACLDAGNLPPTINCVLNSCSTVKNFSEMNRKLEELHETYPWLQFSLTGSPQISTQAVEGKCQPRAKFQISAEGFDWSATRCADTLGKSCIDFAHDSNSSYCMDDSVCPPVKKNIKCCASVCNDGTGHPGGTWINENESCTPIACHKTCNKGFLNLFEGRCVSTDGAGPDECSLTGEICG